MPKQVTKRVPPESGEPYGHHFYASSVAEWKVDTDLAKLMRFMDRQGYRYVLYRVPLPVDADYKIEWFAPQVEGAISLGTYDPAPRKG